MLRHLRVENLGILEEASLDPSTGLTVITGETGAGKTLLLGGLRLLLGEKADASMVGPHADRAQVDGLLDHEGELGVTRVVPRQGNSRAHIEGSIVSAATLAERTGALVEIVSQHDQLNLKRPAYVLGLIDAALDGQEEKALAEYAAAWDAHREALKRKDMLGGDGITLSRELDLARYQSSEIEAAALEPGADEALEKEASRLRNLEEINAHLAEAMTAVGQIREQAGEVVARMRKVAGLDPEAAEATRASEALAESAAELFTQLRHHAESLQADPGRLEEVEHRLTAVGDLKRKYGRTLDEVLAYGEQARHRAAELEELLTSADEVDALVEATEARVMAAGRALRSARESCAARISTEALRHLADLGLETPILEFRFENTEANSRGTERASIWFSSDRRLEPGPVDTVASGGELSRLVLAVRLAARSRGAGTLVFDEVDAGLGGTTALAMGEKLADLARQAQVLCVSHLPQVAAFADRHYLVSREGDTATLSPVEGEERVAEITRMLAGLPESVAGRRAAAELLEEGSRR